MQTNFIEELRWRGMLQDMMPGTEEQLQKEMTAAYIGFDPTASSLHIGNLATIMLETLQVKQQKENSFQKIHFVITKSASKNN
jgi:tyrosyl-tRNA synthetase